MKSAIFILAATVAGGTLGLATSSSQAGQAFRQELTALFAPGADVAAGMRDQQTFYTPNFVQGSPQSLLDNFAVNGKPEATFLNCLRDSTGLETDAMTNLGRDHDHRLTTSLVNCLLTHNRQRFCDAKQRQHVASAIEFYLWSRDYNFNNRAELDRRYKVVHLNEPDASPSDTDPYYKTWDGPDDHAVFSNLKSLARGGYIDPDAFGLLPRYEIRQAMEGAKIEYTGCPPAASQGT